jgi:hypothetical protein
MGPSKVTRLPVQHPQAPHCPTCGRDIPNFNRVFMSIAFVELAGLEIVGFTIHVKCTCGQPLDLRKEAK